MKPQIRAVAFDLDNTLLNFFEAKQAGCLGAAEELVRAGMKGSSKKIAKEILEIYTSLGIESDNVFTQFIESKTGEEDKELLGAAIRGYLTEKNRVLRVYPGILRTIRALRKKKFKLAIVTDASELKALKRIKRTRILTYFDVIQTHSESGFWKPHPKVFSLLLSRLKLKPEEILFVGDIPERDIKGAKLAGMRTAFAKYGWIKKYFPIHDDSERAEFVLDKPEDILEVIPPKV
jgi:HAD superfamily hydrolase (TIGR01662 family)